MNGNTLEIALLAAVAVVLPLLPAIVLYRFLPPGEFSIAGPFHGFQVKLTGAAAAYFAVFVAIGYAFYQGAAPDYELWTVEGEIEAQSGDDLALTISPPRPEIVSSGSTASFRVSQVPLPVGEPQLIPHLVVHKTGRNHEIFPPETVPLQPTAFGGPRYTVSRDERHHKLVIQQTIKPAAPPALPPYSPGSDAAPVTVQDQHR